jgi:hypothetical protein
LRASLLSWKDSLQAGPLLVGQSVSMHTCF